MKNVIISQQKDQYNNLTQQRRIGMSVNSGL